MWKVLTFLKRKPELTRDQFLRSWRDEHAPLMQRQEDFWRHVRRYVQNYPHRDFDGNDFDGVSEMWFDSPEELQAALTEPGFATIQQDAKTFVDVDGSLSWTTEFILYKDGPAPPVKIFAAGQRRQGLTREQAQAHWNHKHPQLCEREAPEFWALIKRYNQNRTQRIDGLPLETWTDDFDFCAESGYATVESMGGARERSDYQEIVHPDEREFAAFEGDIRPIRAVVTESILYDATA